MAMSYNTLTAVKGNPGAIATWVNYTKLDIGTLVDEAQALLYEYLRCNDMKSEFNFGLAIGNAQVPLPANFLDPIGTIFTPSLNYRFIHKDESFILRNRVFNETNGSLGTNALTTTSGSNLVSVNLTQHGFNQASKFNLSGATAA